jgi:hypothetical protein
VLWPLSVPPDRQDPIGKWPKTVLGACRTDVIPTSAVALQSIERRAAIVRVGVRARSAGHSVVCRHGRSCLQGGRFTARVERLKMRLQAGEKIPDVAVELREITDGVQHLLESGLI